MSAQGSNGNNNNVRTSSDSLYMFDYVQGPHGLERRTDGQTGKKKGNKGNKTGNKGNKTGKPTESSGQSKDKK
jgi:hypothetical protein